MTKKKKKVSTGIITAIFIFIITTWFIEPARDFVVNNILKKIIDFIIWILSTIWTFLKNNHEINGFVIIFSSFAWGFVIFILFIIIKENVFKKSATYEDYTQDIFKELKWKWSWGDYGIRNIFCLCPRCDYELSYMEENLYYHERRVIFTCEHCQNNYRIVGYSMAELLSVIKREIQRKIRIGEKPDKKEVSHA